MSGSGRAAVEADLIARVDGALAGGPGPGVVALVEGPPGIGKSHLLDRLCARAREAGHRVLRAGGDERRAREGFVVVEDLVGAAPDGVHPGDHALDRIDGWCADGPVMLCVDDAHRLDAASLGVLRRLAWASRDLPLAVLVGARPYPSPPGLPMVRRIAFQYRLPALDRVETEELAHRLHGGWPGSVLAGLLDRAAGNPLFVVEVLRDLTARGLVHHDGDRMEVAPDTAVPDRLDDAVRGHLATLGETERELLGALAVLGPAAAVEDLAAVLYSPPDEVREVAAAASRSGTVRVDGPRVGFTHDLYLEAAYGLLDDTTRRSTHRRAAQVLGGPAATEHLRAGASGRDPIAADALTDAARRASRFAPAVTADLLAAADGLLDPADAARGRLLLERVAALFLAGRGREAADLAGERLAEVADREVAGGLTALRIRALMNRGDVTDALTAIDATLAGPHLPGPVTLQLGQVRCWLLLLDGRIDDAVAGARALEREHGDAGPSAVRTTLACAEYLRGRPESGLRVLGDVEHEPLPGDQLSGRMTALVWPGTFALVARGPDAARDVIGRVRRLCDERGAGWLRPYLSFVAGGAAMAAADWDDAVAELDTGLELAEEQDAGWISIAVGRRAYLAAHRGDITGARSLLHGFRTAGLPLQFGHDQPGLADLAVLEAEGSGRAAVTLARELWTAAPARGEAWMLAVGADVARTAITEVEQDLLQRVADGLAGITAPQDRTAPPLTALVRGMATGEREPVREAVAALDAAGFAFLAAQADEELACLEAAHGDRTAAESARERALAVYERAGATGDRDRLLARLRRLGIRRGPRFRHRAATTGWDALTPTERRVADLVRLGRTNPEIATALFVSPRTVQTHVSHILGKLGVRSRADVAHAAPADVGMPADVSEAPPS